MTYLFKTITTMKPYNNKKWWIDSNIIKEKIIEADSLAEAFQIYVEKVSEDNYISITKSAVKNKSPMYTGTSDGNAKQIGYVITGSTDFNDRDNYRRVKQYIDLWVEIITVIETNFKAA